MRFFSDALDWLLMRRAHDERVAKRSLHSLTTKARGKSKWRLVHKNTGQSCLHEDVRANTKSEARARFKKMLDQRRIDVGLKVVAVE